MAEDAVHDAASVLGALADRTRLQILSALAGGEASVGELQAQLGLAQPLASFHLTRLRRAGLVRTRRDWNRIFYALDPDGCAVAQAAVARVLAPMSRTEATS